MAASALLIDYVLTVAVSVVAGVAAITRAVPALADHAVALSLGFVAIMLLMVGVGLVKLLLGEGLEAISAGFALQPESHAAVAFLALRAFASGSTALTGVEAVSNGVPAFAEPKSRNAAATLVIAGARLRGAHP